jgi:enamine deaminase RidA (YjgF/YER057c/UK114 family)
MGPEDLVKVTTYLTHREQADANGRIRRERLGGVRPAITVVVVQTLAAEWLLEIEAIAAA